MAVPNRPLSAMFVGQAISGCNRAHLRQRLKVGLSATGLPLWMDPGSRAKAVKKAVAPTRAPLRLLVYKHLLLQYHRLAVPG